MLNEQDKERLKEYAIQTLGELNETLQKMVNGWSLFSNNLEAAKGLVDNYAREKKATNEQGEFSGLSKVKDKSTASLMKWVKMEPEEKDQALSLKSRLTPVWMSRFSFVSGGKTNHILWTASVGGCLGVCRVHGHRCFPGALGSGYITEFRQALVGEGYRIARELTGDRLAINADTGEIETDFNVDELNQ